MKNIFNLIARFLVTVGCGIMVFTRSGIERIGWLLLFLGFGYCFVHKALHVFMETMEKYNRRLYSEEQIDSGIPNMMNNMVGDVIDGVNEDDSEEKSDEC